LSIPLLFLYIFGPLQQCHSISLFKIDTFFLLLISSHKSSPLIGEFPPFAFRFLHVTT
jgi:hypothetical protein